MTIRQATTIVGLALLCVTLARADGNAFQLSVSSGVSVPKIKELEAKVQQSFTAPGMMRTYKLETRRWVDVTPSVPAEYLTAVVRSYDESTRTAYLQFTQRQYNMPVLQVWRFGGRTWSDQLDPGIFVQSQPTPAELAKLRALINAERAPAPR